MITRRQFLIGSLGGLIAVGAGNAVYRQETFLRERLTELVGSFNMSEEQFDRFEQEFFASLRPKQKLGIETLNAFGLLDINLPKVFNKVDEFDRKLMTDFIISTQFLKANKNENLVYGNKRLVCNNPFATLTPP